MSEVITAATTPLDALERAFDRAATYNERSRVAPAAILWPDEKEEWTRLLPRLRERFPQLLTLGKYDPEKKRGPAIWLKCMIGRTLEAADWPRPFPTSISRASRGRTFAPWGPKRYNRYEDVPDEYKLTDEDGDFIEHLTTEVKREARTDGE